MNWNVHDIDTYLQAKEYVDTALISLIPIQWGKEIKTTVSMGEYSTFISHQLERQFKGRLILFPDFSYLKSEELSVRAKRLKSWEEELKGGGIKHFFYLTSDPEWKGENSVVENLIWTPYLPLEHVDEKYKDSMVKDQISQLIPIFMNAWKKE